MPSRELDVPLPKRILQITCSIIWCLLAAGPVFGFAALKPVLVAEGVYSDVCEKSSLQIMVGGGTATDEEVIPCVDQDLKLNFMFTIAAVVTNVASLMVGSILDKYGPRVSGIIGSILIFIAANFLKFSSQIKFVDPYLTGYTFLALGGPFVFISCFRLANTFPKNSGLILALLTGAFDSSSALFLCYRLMYQNHIFQDLSLNKFFNVYMIVPIFIFVCQITIMPKDSYKTVNTLAKIGEIGVDETGDALNPDLADPNTQQYQSRTNSFASFDNERTHLLTRTATNNSMKSVFEQEQENRKTHSSGGIYGICHDLQLTQQLKTPWFIFMCLFTSIQMLRINYFVATVRSQEEFLFNETIAVKINQFFDMALPLGGIASIPFIGILLDNCTTLSVLKTLTTVSVAIGFLGIVKNQFCAYLGIVLLVVYRPFYYTAVSDYCAKVFGFETFGTIYGAIICTSGVLNLLQSQFDHITHFTFNLNPIPVNLTLTLITVLIGAMLIVYVISQEKAIKKKQILLEAETASVSDMPH